MEAETWVKMKDFNIILKQVLSCSLCFTATQFNRLERMDVGGSHGRELTLNVRIIHADFQLAMESFNKASSNEAMQHNLTVKV